MSEPSSPADETDAEPETPAAAILEAAVPEPASHDVARPVPALDTPGSPVDRFDDRIDQWFDRGRGNAALDRTMYTITELADFSLLWHLIAAARGASARDVNRGFAESVRLSMVLGAESLVVNGVLKSVFKRRRPVPEFERPLHLRVPLTSSFPSGHASAAFCAAVVLSDTSRLGRLWYGVAASVAASRVYVKIHHPSDVVAGATVGLVAGVAARRLWRLPRPISA